MRYKCAMLCKETVPVVGEVTVGGGVPEEAGSTEMAAQEAGAGDGRQMTRKTVAARRSRGRPVEEVHRKTRMVAPVTGDDAL